MASAGLRRPSLNLLILFNFKARLKKNPSANQKIAKHDEELMLLTRRSAERLLLRNPPTDSGQSFLL